MVFRIALTKKQSRLARRRKKLTLAVTILYLPQHGPQVEADRPLDAQAIVGARTTCPADGGLEPHLAGDRDVPWAAGPPPRGVDPDPICLTRFSRWVRRVHRCPPAAVDPVGYLELLRRVVLERRIDVVLPTHEQAWLLAIAAPRLSPGIAVAVADAGAFGRVQSKVAFAGLLDELGMPQPAWRLVESSADLAELPFPYWLKAAFGTAGEGVREVLDGRWRDAALDALLGQGDAVMAQAPAAGQYGQVQGLFDRGRLVAVHTSVQVGVGVGGSAAARMSVDHQAAREHISLLGGHLGWHGGLTLDYFHEHGSPSYRGVQPTNRRAGQRGCQRCQHPRVAGSPNAR